jgi:Tol biopolymer transport system component
MPPTATPEPPLYQTLASGTYLVYSAYQEPTPASLEIVDLEGHMLGQLASGVGPYVRLAADGHNIAFQTEPTTNSQGIVAILDLETGEQTYVAPTTQCTHPSWGPDETQIVADCNGLTIIEGATNRRRTWLSGTELYSPVYPEWSPDGRWLSYWEHLSCQQCYPNYLGPFLIDATCMDAIETCAQTSRRLGEMRYGSARAIAWSPDSQLLAVDFYDYETHDPVVQAFLIFNVVTGELVRALDITNYDLNEITSLAWSPDGQHLAFVQRDPNSIYIIPVGGGEPQLIVSSQTRRSISDVVWLVKP